MVSHIPGGCKLASSSITGTNGFLSLTTNFFTDCRFVDRTFSGEDDDGLGDFWDAKRITLVALLEHGLTKHSSLKTAALKAKKKKTKIYSI